MIKKYFGILLLLISTLLWYFIYLSFRRWLDLKEIATQGEDYESGFGWGVVMMATFVCAMMLSAVLLLKPKKQK